MSSLDIQQRVALFALNEMLTNKRYFDICTVDNVCDMLGVPHGSSPAYRTLRALHCVHYDRMPCDIQAAIPELLKDIIGEGPMATIDQLLAPARHTSRTLVVVEAAAKPEKTGLRRLLGI